jgi:hypothetical protein
MSSLLPPGSIASLSYAIKLVDTPSQLFYTALSTALLPTGPASSLWQGKLATRRPRRSAAATSFLPIAITYAHCPLPPDGEWESLPVARLQLSEMCHDSWVRGGPRCKGIPEM